MIAAQWNQSRFDAALKDYLMVHESSVWPKAINKKAFFVAKAAIEATPAVESATIDSDLNTEVTAKREDGKSANIPRGIALAATLAARNWKGSKRYGRVMERRAMSKRSSLASAWRQEIKAHLGRIRGSRKAATSFLRLGWKNVQQALGPHTGLSYSGSSVSIAKQRGRFKGQASPATAGRLQVTIANLAHAQSETRGGFERLGQPALDRAMQQEAQSMVEHLQKEMEPGIRKFNRS